MDRIGRYKIVRELGRGAMGVVYHAIDPNIGRPVAIKTIQLGGPRTAEEQERLRERLFREARSAGILSHPNIVTIYDVEQQGELAYIAMEYVDGPTLDQLLTRPQAISPEMMFGVLGQTAAALDYAHQKGIVHRDIKPANVMIAGASGGYPGTVKITDFGIAKITATEQFTMTGNIVGTPHYMSPEQVQGLSVDGRSDQFSLAVVAYEMLTGEKPFTGEHLTTVVFKIVAEEPAPVQRLNSSLSGGIENVMRKVMAKKPDDRYASCEQFINALEQACASSRNWRTMPRGGSLNAPTVAEKSLPSIPIPPARRRTESSGTAEQARPKKSSFLTFLLGILMAAGLLALIGWQAAPFLNPNSARNAPKEPAKQESPKATAPESPVAKAPETPAVPPASQPEQTSPTAPATPAQKAPDPKPSPMPPAQPKQPSRGSVAEQTPDPPRRPATVMQPVTIITSPGGATATLDGRTDLACTTPCSIEALPGRHSIAVTMAGYQTESREVTVGTGPVELPAVILRTQGGTLMLTSVPSGATVLVDGNRVSHVTPAQIPLPHGVHKITVEKDGRQATQSVEIRGGISYLKIALEP